MDTDKLVQHFRKVEPSRFKKVTWPVWDNALYDPKLSNEHLLAFCAGALYVRHCLVDFRPDWLGNILGWRSLLFLRSFKIDLVPQEIEPAIVGNQIILATFHSGALHIITKMREQMSEQVRQEGLGECVDSLEVDLHKQFMWRMAGVAVKDSKVATQSGAIKLRDMLVEGFRVRPRNVDVMEQVQEEEEQEDEDQEGRNQNEGDQNVVAHDGEDQEEGDQEEEEVGDEQELEDHTGHEIEDPNEQDDDTALEKARVRAKSKKAKKLRQKARKAHAANDEDGK